MKLDRLVKLEKKLAGIVDRKLRDPGTPPDVLELLPMILDYVEERVQPTGDGGQVFPYDRIRVSLAIESERAAAMAAVLEHPPGLEERIRARLLEAGCLAPDLKVSTRILEAPKPEAWGELPFRIQFRARRRGRPPEARRVAVPRVRLSVLAGSAGARAHAFQLARINIGRLQRVEDRSQDAVRRNHLAFADDGSKVNATVSRAHAHIRYDSDANVFRLFDDGSAHGTRILRRGRYLAVPRRGSRGVLLQHGDELEFGSARARFLIRDAEEDAGAAGPPS